LAEIRLDVLEVGVIVEQVIELSEHGFEGIAPLGHQRKDVHRVVALT
jgi:hypothetical protein